MRERRATDRRPPGRAGPLPLLVIALTQLAAACAPSGRDDGRATPAVRSLVLAYAGELQTLDPLVSTDQNANELIYAALFTPLVTYDEEFRIRPWLARSWELTPDGVTFELRDDVTWHDGAPVTAADVKFTFDLAKNPVVASPLGAAYLGQVASAEVLGPHRIRFDFVAPHAEPLEDFAWPPVPRHLLEGVAPEEIARHPFGREPVGSGPYRFVSWAVGQGIELEGRDDFPEALGGPPEIRRVSYRIVPEPSTRVAQLRRGDVQVDGPVGPAEAARLEGEQDIEVVSFPWRQFTYIGWNTRRDPFREPDARRALAMAIDRGELLDAILRGRGRPAASVIPPWHPFAPDLAPLPYAPDSAAAMLDRLGWRDEDGDGVRERGGVPLRFELLASSRNPVFGDLVQVIQAQLAKVGVDVRPRLLEWQTVLGMHRSRDFDAVLTNWVLDGFRVDPRPLFHSSQALIEGSANRGSYESAEADSLMDRAAVTLDPAEATGLWGAFARVIQRDQPITMLFWNDELIAFRREVVPAALDARGELATLARWRWRP